MVVPRSRGQGRRGLTRGAAAVPPAVVSRGGAAGTTVAIKDEGTAAGQIALAQLWDGGGAARGRGSGRLAAALQLRVHCRRAADADRAAMQPASWVQRRHHRIRPWEGCAPAGNAAANKDGTTVAGQIAVPWSTQLLDVSGPRAEEEAVASLQQPRYRVILFNVVIITITIITIVPPWPSGELPFFGLRTYSSNARGGIAHA